jgi:hypothetical protein
MAIDPGSKTKQKTAAAAMIPNESTIPTLTHNFLPRDRRWSDASWPVMPPFAVPVTASTATELVSVKRAPSSSALMVACVHSRVNLQP